MVHTTERLYKETIKQVLLRAMALYEHKDFQGCVDLLTLAIPVAQFASDLVDAMMLYQVMAFIEFHRKSYERCLEICHLVIYMCCDREVLYDVRIDMLKMSAMCHMQK